MEISDVGRNTKLIIEGVPYNVEEAEFTKPGKGRAIYRLRLRNLLTGSVIDRTYHSGEKAEEARTATSEEQYLYREADQYIFMNTESFEQHPIDEALLGDNKDLLKEGTVVTVLRLNDRPIGVTLPIFVELKVVDSGVAVRFGTITPQNKQAVLETGATVGVPAFIKEGDVIKVDTRTGTYVERVAVKK